MTLTQLQNLLSNFGVKNFLFLVISLSLLGLSSFNLWLLTRKTIPISPTSEQSVTQNLVKPKSDFGQVLSEATKSAGQPSFISQIAGKVKIAALGDSMIDTLGDLKNLQLSLSQYYPNVEFTLLNYGVGSTKPANGLRRLTQPTSAPNSATGAPKNLPPLLVERPDIVIVESYSYNHGQNTSSEIATHYQTIAEIINTLQRSDIQVLFLVTIAPTANYAQGAPGILWDENQRILEAKTVIEYLKAGLKFAKDNNLILIDAFNPSLDKTGFGKQIYVNSTDNIHPSGEGSEFISDLIAQKIAEEKSIEKIITP